MSYDLHFIRFQKGMPSGCDSAGVKKAFGTAMRDADESGFTAFYDKKNQAQVVFMPDDEDEATISGFVVERPCADARLWASLFAILTSDSFVMMTQEGTPVIAGSVSAKNIPKEMKADAIIAKTPEDLLKAIESEA